MDDDRISLKEACTIAGKSERTLRRWLKEGILEDLRTPGDKASPIQVSSTRLRSHLATMTAPLPSTARHGTEAGPPATTAAPETREGGAPGHDHQIALQALQGQVDTLKALVATVEKQRDWCMSERAHLTDRVVHLERELAESRAARAAIEKEMAGRQGVRGLLKAFWPK